MGGSRDGAGVRKGENNMEAVRASAQFSSLITVEMQQALRLGEVIGVFTYAVTASDVEHFARAISDPDRPWSSESRYEGGSLPVGTEAPPTFFAALDPVERRDLEIEGFLDAIPYPMTGGGNAFNEVTYERLIRVGDTLTVSTKFVEIYERDGKAGRLLFRVRENFYVDSNGSDVAWSRCGHVRAYNMSTLRGD